MEELSIFWFICMDCDGFGQHLVYILTSQPLILYKINQYINQSIRIQLQVQRLYYQVSSLKIACIDPPADYPTYQDINKDKHTAAAFSSSTFRDTLNPTTCLNVNDCLWADVDSVTYDTFSEDNANVFVQRYMDVEMYLKCVNRDGYGPTIANVLIEAMDSYFELYVEEELTQEILTNVPQSAVYNYASPYGKKTDRLFFTHGPYYTGGDIIDQVRDEDGDLVTKYTYGFDVVWFWPKGKC